MTEIFILKSNDFIYGVFSSLDNVKLFLLKNYNYVYIPGQPDEMIRFKYKRRWMCFEVLCFLVDGEL